MNDLPDQQLLRDYSDHGSETAFTELVRRHVDLVYSASLRMIRDAQQAEDITQNVFIALARNASKLKDRQILSGWLHNTARNVAANTVRANIRRHTREQEAATMNELSSSHSEVTWDQIAPQLDLALGELNELDRDALLLRYFERRTAHEMALALGINEEAAQKRVNRAVERLRNALARNKVSVGAGGLVAIISANAVQSAPLGLAASIAESSLLSAAAVHASATGLTVKLLAMTVFQKAFVATAVVTIAGTGIYEASKLHLDTMARPGIAAIANPRSETNATALTVAALDQHPSDGSPVSTTAKSKPVTRTLRKMAHEPTLAAAEDDLKNSLAILGQDADITPDVFVQKGEIQARAGKWKEAVTNLEHALRIDPADAWAGYLLSSVLLEAGNLADYQAHSHAMMMRFGNTDNRIVAGRTGEAYLVAPYGENTDLHLSVQMIERKSFFQWREFYEGLAQYRLGHYRSAAGLLEKDINQLSSVNHIDRPACEADCFLLLAMVWQQLNQSNDARAAFAHGSKVAEKQMAQPGSPDLGPYWWNGVTTRALLKEAREIVESTNANPVHASLTFSLGNQPDAAPAQRNEIIPVSGPFSEPPPGALRILPESITMSGTRMQFTVAGVMPGATVLIEASRALFTPDSWVPISTNVATGTTLSVGGIDTANSQNQFFRVVQTYQ